MYEANNQLVQVRSLRKGMWPLKELYIGIVKLTQRTMGGGAEADRTDPF